MSAGVFHDSRNVDRGDIFPEDAGTKLARSRGKHPNYRQVLNPCRKNSVDAVRVAIELMNDREVPPAVRLGALTCVHDRAWGRADKHVELNAESGAPALRIEFVTAPQSNQRTINGASDSHVIEAIEFDPTQGDK